MKKKITKIFEILSWMTADLEKRGIDTPRLDAELILSHALGIDRVHLYINFDKPLLDDELVKIKPLFLRRRKREPIAYISGKKEFYSLELNIKKGVLIPRPDTELIVDIGINKLKDIKKDSIYIADLGTGSGAIAIALASELEFIKVLAIDYSADAVEVAKSNVEKFSLEKRIKVVQGDMNDVIKRQKYLFEAIFTNPPYIPSGQIKSLMPEVCKYEPLAALDGGEDGLDSIRKIISSSSGKLVTDGFLATEIGDDQSDRVINLFKQNKDYHNIEAYNDLAGKKRIVLAYKK